MQHRMPHPGQIMRKPNMPLCMQTISRLITPILCGSILFFSGLNLSSAQPRSVELNLSNQTLSAKIKEAPLRDVIETMEKEGVWFKLWLKGKESVLDERVSVTFTGLPVQQGLERILSTLNHCLVFDRNGRLSGVILLGKPDRRTTRSTRGTRVLRRTPRRYNPRR